MGHPFVVSLALVAAGCVSTAATELPPRTPAAMAPAETPLPGRVDADDAQEGYATWYGARFAGRRTASGEPFDPWALTAAHRTLPFGTWVKVTRIDTGQSVRVRITDRGPYGGPGQRRIIDLSRAAAERIDLLRAGVAPVKVRVIGLR
jgi:rare lipoprotein A